MDYEHISDYIINESIDVVKALQKMDCNGSGILFVVDNDNTLIGTLTDGDVRRWLISTGNLKAKITQIMGRNPKYLFDANKKEALNFMCENRIKAIPILDSNHKIVNIVFNTKLYDDMNLAKTDCLSKIPVVIMAGGKGTRLYPYTKILPKPLIPIGDVPIIERIMNKFYHFGANSFFVTVNYKKEMIKSYFSDINPPYKIEYIEEEQPLGTAGSIKLIKKKFDTPIIVTNCDILIESDYKEIIDYHIKNHNAMTIVSSLKNTVIPYGVLRTSTQGKIDAIDEKPQISYLVNTGMYVINPEMIELIPSGESFHMTELADKMLAAHLQVGMYPVSEQAFLDMGEFSEMKKMEERINNGF